MVEDVVIGDENRTNLEVKNHTGQVPCDLSVIVYPSTSEPCTNLYPLCLSSEVTVLETTNMYNHLVCENSLQVINTNSVSFDH